MLSKKDRNTYEQCTCIVQVVHALMIYSTVTVKPFKTLALQPYGTVSNASNIPMSPLRHKTCTHNTRHLASKLDTWTRELSKLKNFF